MRIKRVPGRRHVDVLVAVEVPIALRHGERVVRMRERGDQQERPRIARSRDVPRNRALGHECGLVVEMSSWFERTHSPSRVANRAHVVDTSSADAQGAIPVRRPAG